MNEPPLGIVPRFIHEKERLFDIVSAMNRMLVANTQINSDWVEELRDLVPNYNKEVVAFAHRFDVVSKDSK